MSRCLSVYSPQATVPDSAVVKGVRRSPKYFLGNAISPNNSRTRGNGDTVAFHEVGLERNAKSFSLKYTVSVFKLFIFTVVKTENFPLNKITRGKSLKLLPPDVIF